MSDRMKLPDPITGLPVEIDAESAPPAPEQPARARPKRRIIGALYWGLVRLLLWGRRK